MKRRLVVVAVLVALMGVGSLAIADPTDREGVAYRKHPINYGVEVTPLPRPVDSEPVDPVATAAVPGPVAKAGGSEKRHSAALQGGAIPSMAGGAILTPTQRTEKEIRRVIRKLQ